MEDEDGEDDTRIGELFQRAELGRPFGYRRDVNLLMDVICDRLSSRLCHRCVRQTSPSMCPRLPPSTSESCQCQQSDGTGTCGIGLVQGREQITQTLPNRCDSCNVTLCPKAGLNETVSKTSNEHTLHAGDTDLNEGYSASDVPITDCRQTRFSKSRSFLEDKFKQGMAEKARMFAHKKSQHKPPSRQYHNLHSDNATSSSMSQMDSNKLGDKSVYIKGTNPFLDKLKFELQNDEETKHEFAKLFQDTDNPSQLLPFEFETPTKFKNRTVGATHHNGASPVDLLRRRLSRNNGGKNSSENSNFKFDVHRDEQIINDDYENGLSFTKRVGNWNKFDSNGEVIWRKIEGEPDMHCEETQEVDPNIHRQLMALIPRAAMRKGGCYNALIGFADNMSHEAGADDTPYKNELTDIEPNSTGGVEYKGVQAVPSSYQAQTQTHDNSTRDIMTSQQETQTSHTELNIKPTTLCETGKCCGTVHADVYTQTSKTPQRSNQHLPFSLNTWTQTPRNSAPKETNFDQTPGSLHRQSDPSSDWSTIVASDSDYVLPLNPRNTVNLYKESFKKLNNKLTGNEHLSDSDSDVAPNVGRVLESAHITCPDSWNTQAESSISKNKSTQARSFQYSHPVLRDVLSLGDPVPSPISDNTEGIKADEIRTSPPPDLLGCYHEWDLAAFFELHHLDVPVSIRKKREKRVSQQSKTYSQRLDVQQDRMEADRTSPDQNNEQLDHVTSKPHSHIASVLPSPTKKKVEFHQGALNQFETSEGTRRLSWRDQAPISRKAKFYETEADIAGETKHSEEKRKMSASAETSAVRRISLFEEFGRNVWK